MTILRGKFQLFSCRSGKAYAQKLGNQLQLIIEKRHEELSTKKTLSSREQTELDFVQSIQEEDVRVGKANILEFGDGEMDVILDNSENVRDKDVFLVSCPYNTTDDHSINTNIMETLIFIDTLHRAKARSVSLISLYYPYSRGDKQHAKDGIPAKLLANMYKTSGLNNLITMDLHADQIMGFFDSQFIRIENMHASSLMIHFLKDRLGDEARIAAPDTGAAKRTQYVAKHLNKRMIMAYKRRSYEKTHTIDEMKILGLPGEEEVVILDDMVASGGSVIKMIDILKEKGVPKVTVAVAHPMLIKNAVKHFDEAYKDRTNPFDLLIGTDSIPHKQEILDKPWYKEINTSKFIAKTIYEIHTSGSVTQLHKPDCVKDLDLWID